MVATLRKLRKHLTENADYVGPKFAEEARRIHYNEAEKRGIYGEATSDEARALARGGDRVPSAPGAAGRPQLTSTVAPSRATCAGRRVRVNVPC